MLTLVACTQTNSLSSAGSGDETPFYLVATPTPEPTAVSIPTPIPPFGTPSVLSPTAYATPVAVVPIPTATPLPTPTPAPQPTATPLPLPAATPTPPPLPEDSTTLDLGGDLSLNISPENTISGRNVSFSLSGVNLWEPVTVSFLDPDGVPAPWITSEDVHLVNSDQVRSTYQTLYPNPSGETSWKRYAGQDVTGQWTVDIGLTDGVYRAIYTLTDLNLRDVEQVLLGTLLTRRVADNFVIYYSELIPTALVVDLQDHLSQAAQIIDRQIQAETKQIPDIYLMGNRSIMSKVSTFTGIDLGFEDGYYANFGERPGIFIMTDLMATEVRRLLTHEYAHHVFDGLSRSQTIPAWLTEGLAEYYEFYVAESSPRPHASELREYATADLAQAAAQEGGLFTLEELASQSDWNSRAGDGVSLQYAQAYMTIRFLTETYGPLAGKDLVVQIGDGLDISDALVAVTGLDLTVFELQFNRWLRRWEDPERRAVAEYLAALDVILTEETANSNLRAQNINSSMTQEESVSSHAFLVDSTESLIQDLQALSPPERALELHQEVNDHFGRVMVWLSLELDAAKALDNGPLIAANKMIPEINARDFIFKRNISNLEFLFNLSQQPPG